MRAPICVYVLYHHKSELAKQYSRAIYDWLRALYIDRDAKDGASSIDLQRLGLGVPVFYRTSFSPSGTEAEDLRIHRIPYGDAACNVIVPLVDEKMVNDPRWRSFLRHVSERDEGDTVVLPVALHGSAYRLDASLGGRNFIRIEPTQPPHSLRRRLVEGCLRALLRGMGYETRPQTQIFISHAKGDSRHVGVGYRDAIARYGQINAFFDENDIPYGANYRSVLGGKAKDVDAMLCIHSDLYSSRPWCRMEISAARRPRRVRALDHEPESTAEIYSSVPLLIVDHLTHHPTRYLPEFGYATVVRGELGREEEILDMLMREALNGTHHNSTARALAASHAESQVASSEESVYFSFVPNLTAIRHVVVNRKKSGRKTRQVIYPGAGLTTNQRDDLAVLGGKIRLTTFQELKDVIA